MKPATLSLLIGLCALGTVSSQTMKVHVKSSGTVANFMLADIDSITFELGLTIPTEGLVAYYPFSGSAADASGNGHDGTVSGATGTADRNGIADAAYAFNGTDASISVPHHADFDFTGTDSMTISFWCRPVSISKKGGILAKCDPTGTSSSNYCIVPGYYSDGKFDCIFGHYGPSDYVSSAASVALNTWQHVAVVYTLKTVTIYIDGTLDNSGSISLDPATNTGALIIGNDADGASEFFNGAIDDIAIYSRALSAAEIAELAGQ